MVAISSVAIVGATTPEPAVSRILANEVPACSDPKVFLQAGDVVEVEIDGVGLLANPVVDAA